MDENKRKRYRFSVSYFVVAMVAMWLFQILIFQPMVVRWGEAPYSEFRQELAADNIDEVTIGEDRIIYTLKESEEGTKQAPVHNTVRIEDPDLITELAASSATFSAEAPNNNILLNILGWILPFLPMVLIYYFLYKRMMSQGGGMPGAMSIGKSNAREIAGELTGIGFDDVGGVDEVVVELKEVIDFLKTPEEYTKLGAKLPKGVLLVGPPGTGKTLLARATAGEAGVPFFTLSGSDFVEMFVGVGAARVRDLFEQAKKKSPCIVFIDEIDAIGQSRSTAGAMVSNDEREQTLNQLLAEMDGFEENSGVIIMGATNRPEVLDAALLRPGRFDRQVQVTLPTEGGRLQILKIHTRGVPLAADVDMDRLAQITPGFAGADLANIVNEAALMAVRRNSTAVSMKDFDLAIERVIAGLQRSMPLSDAVKRKVAYHEGGHALVAQLLPDTDPVHKVSIIPTAKGALGYTMQMPQEDQYLLSESELRQRMAVMLGGRAAELLVFDEATTGASNDLERATDLARRMVTEFGMSEALGPVRYTTSAGMGYLGMQSTLRQDMSPETARLIDEQVRALVQEAQDWALSLLKEHREALDQSAEVLIKREVISGDEIAAIASGRLVMSAGDEPLSPPTV